MNRNFDEETAQTLEVLDTPIGDGVSAEHRAILHAALAQTSGRSFNELLSSMPNVGEDSDFAPSRG
jgi:plasmid stability protein